MWTDKKNQACSEFVNHKISSNHSYPFHNFSVCAFNFVFIFFLFEFLCTPYFISWHTGQNHVVLPILHTDTVNQAQYLKSWDILSSKLPMLYKKREPWKYVYYDSTKSKIVLFVYCLWNKGQLDLHVHHSNGDNN